MTEPNTPEIPAPSANSYAVITGASSGIGRALALELGKRGHNLIVVARSAGPMEEIAAQLPNVDVQVRSVDLANVEARTEFIQELKRTDVHIISTLR